MPPKRRRSISVDGSVRPAPRRSSTQTLHVARACDDCRKRKARCDGIRPQCNMCAARGSACYYTDEDRRRTNIQTVQDLQKRMTRVEALVERLMRSGSAGGDATALSLDTSDQPLLALPGAASDGSQGQGASEASDSEIDDCNDYEQFLRVEEEAGALVQFGPTSLWTCRDPRSATTLPVLKEPPKPGDWVDWSRNLPSTLDINRQTHDTALEYFAAYYAPWCLTVDMAAFLEDMSTCNLVRQSNPSWSAPTRTSNYSPLMHNSVLFLGLHLIRDQHPGIMAKLQTVFLPHCSALLLVECDQTALSSMRAYNLFANCMHFLRNSEHGRPLSSNDRQYATGYLLSGLAIAAVHSLGLNVKVDPTLADPRRCADLQSEAFVAGGRITEKERRLRDNAFWSVYIQDIPMLSDRPAISLPVIEPDVDAVPWRTPLGKAGMLPVGHPSMRSTCFHWTARLAVLGRAVLETIYSPQGRHRSRAAAVEVVTAQLEDWHREFLLQLPASSPLPNVLQLHMQYQLLVLLVHRPYYRSPLASSAGCCDRASLEILQLLEMFDTFHDLRYGHHNLLNPIFAAGTVFLLQSVDASGDHAEGMRRFEQCVRYLRRHALTWREDAVAAEILESLKAEYLPRATENSAPVAGPLVDPFDELQQWLSASAFDGTSLADQDFAWDLPNLAP